MGAFDWLKTKLSQGVGDLEHIGQNVVNDVSNVGHAVFGGGATSAPSAQPSVPTIKIAPPSTNSSVTSSPSLGLQPPTNPSTTSTVPASSGAVNTPVVSGLHLISDIDNVLNNPIAALQAKLKGQTTPTAASVVTNQTVPTNNTTTPPAAPIQPQKQGSGSPIDIFHSVANNIHGLINSTPVGAIENNVIMPALDAAGNFIHTAVTKPTSTQAKVASNIPLLNQAVSFSRQQAVNPPSNLLQGEGQLISGAGGAGVAASPVGAGARILLGSAATFTPTESIDNPVTNFLTSGKTGTPELAFARAYDEAPDNPLSKFLTVAGDIGDALNLKVGAGDIGANNVDVPEAIQNGAGSVRDAYSNSALANESGHIGIPSSPEEPIQPESTPLEVTPKNRPVETPVEPQNVTQTTPESTPTPNVSEALKTPQNEGEVERALTNQNNTANPTELATSEPQVAQTAIENPTLPKNLAGATPNYNYGSKAFQLNFPNDTTKALYIVGGKGQSAAHEGYMDFLRNATGQSDEDIAKAAQQVRTDIKAQAKVSKAGSLDVPAHGDTVAPSVTNEPNWDQIAEERDNIEPQHLDAFDREIAKKYATSSPDEMAQALGLDKTAEQLNAEREAALARVGAGTEERPDATPHILTPEERQDVIDNNQNQQTKNNVSINVPEGNIKGGIAQATGIVDQMKNRFAKAISFGDKLSEEDRNLLYKYDDGTPLNEILDQAKNKPAVLKAITAIEDAHDYSLAADRAAGGLTFRQENYIPHYYQASEKMMDELGIPENERFAQGNYRGFHDAGAKYKSYLQADRETGGLLKPLYKNPLDAIDTYSKGAISHLKGQALYKAMQQAAPKEVADLGIVGDEEGRRFTQAAGRLPFNASKKLQPYLKNFGEGIKISNPAIKATVNGLERTNAAAKQILLSGAPFHYVNILKNFLGLTLGSGHPVLAARGTLEALASSFNPKFADSLAQHYIDNGTAEFKAKMGVNDAETMVHERNVEGTTKGALKVANAKYNPLNIAHRNMNGFINTLGDVLVDAARKHGIDPESAAGTALGEEYNKVLGRINEQVMGTDPTLSKALSQGSLAPHYTRSQLALVKDALTKKGSPLGLYTQGGVARSTVVGARAVEASFAIIASALLAGQLPTFKQMISEAGLLPSNPIPNINAGQKNSKGESQLLNLPTDQFGLIAGAIKDPTHFGISRYSPALSIATQAITNTNWNGDPLVDKSKPNWQLAMAVKLAQNLSPIGAQNFTNKNIDLAQSVAQEFGVRVKTNPQDPQAAASTAYFKQQAENSKNLLNGNFSAINPALAGIDPKYGPYFAAQYAALHPANQTDINGVHIPQPWDALSNQRLPSYYLMNDPKTGAQELSPLYYVDKAAAQQDPSRPHNGLFDLSDAQAKVALDYQNTPSGDPQRTMMVQQNPWLTDYETNQSVAAQNYVPIMTKFLQSEGWTAPAIQNYWNQHPQSTAPLTPPVFPQATQDLMSQYDAITDPTQRSAFFAANADTLGAAFDATAQYVNQRRVDSGDLAEYQSPNETPEVKAILDSMPTGTDAASKKARAQLINNNPAVNQYLADVALQTATKDLAENYYQTPGKTEGQVLNNGSKLSQQTLKEIASLGNYDIAKDANGNYNFMQNGTTDGTTGSGSSSSKRKPTVPFGAKLKKRKAFLKSAPHHGKVRKPFVKSVHGAGWKPIKVSKTGGFNGSIIKISK